MLISTSNISPKFLLVEKQPKSVPAFQVPGWRAIYASSWSRGTRGLLPQPPLGEREREEDSVSEAGCPQHLEKACRYSSQCKKKEIYLVQQRRILLGLVEAIFFILPQQRRKEESLHSSNKGLCSKIPVLKMTSSDQIRQIILAKFYSHNTGLHSL